MFLVKNTSSVRISWKKPSEIPFIASLQV
jgi:hypothetical protein